MYILLFGTESNKYNLKKCGFGFFADIIRLIMTHKNVYLLDYYNIIKHCVHAPHENELSFMPVVWCSEEVLGWYMYVTPPYCDVPPIEINNHIKNDFINIFIQNS